MGSGFYDHAWGVISGCLFATSPNWSSLAFLLVVCIFVQFLRFNRTHQHDQLPLLQETEGPTLPDYSIPSLREVHHTVPPSRYFPPPFIVSTPTVERIRVKDKEPSPSTHFHSITGLYRSAPPPRRSRAPRSPKAYRTLPSTPPPLSPSAPPSSPVDTPSPRASTPIPPRTIIWTSQPLRHVETCSPADSPLLRTPTPVLAPTWTARSLFQYGDQAQGQRYYTRDPGDIQVSLFADLQTHVLLPEAVILPTIHHAHPIHQQEESLVNTRDDNNHVATLESPICLRAGNLAIRPWEIEIDILPERGKAERRNLKRRVIGNPVEDDFASPAHPSASPVPDERQKPFFRSPNTLGPSPCLVLESPDADWFDDSEVDRQQRRRQQRRFVEMQRLPAKKQRLLGEEAVKRGKKAMDEERTRESLFWMLQAEIHHKEMERLNRLAAFAIFREKNKNMTGGEVDLHGLYVKEAVHYAARGLECGLERGDREVRFIVGKGKHAPDGIARIKPAIKTFLTYRGLVWRVAPHNQGMLIVKLPALHPADFFDFSP